MLRFVDSILKLGQTIVFNYSNLNEFNSEFVIQYRCTTMTYIGSVHTFSNAMDTLNELMLDLLPRIIFN